MKKTAILGGFAIAAASTAWVPALAYDGTNCRAPGNCWEAKPGYPEKVEGSEYDPQHDPMELNKQQESIQGMEARNAQRLNHFKQTGEFIFDVSEIPASSAGAGEDTDDGDASATDANEPEASGQ
ncbi:methanol dehydrogenase (cytochrome c) subunit 2 [Aurantimonas endophytica]|uniref:Methanol dehydrogenase (Cytochrome c) subunit 2 n=1 Tax=Aurantimonas endophytica TaxID=1522175 RepID=A0A7W6HBK6_9HYPH|nr:methanol dehydrogenase (cytochrome c) subunit 2 [Aurantimonas endophytica]MCO6402297.1 methanol dehydrogenase [Aurantimonas endophytica]